MKIKASSDYWLGLAYLAFAAAAVIFALSGCGEHRAARLPGGGGAPGHDANQALLWIVVVSVFGIGACVTAAIFLPIKSLATAVGAGFITTLILAITVKAILPFLPWVALGVGLLAVVGVIWYFRKQTLATGAAVLFGHDMTQANSEVEAQEVKDRHALAQATIGVKTIIDDVHDAAEAGTAVPKDVPAAVTRVQELMKAHVPDGHVSEHRMIHQVIRNLVLEADTIGKGK